MPSSGEGRKGLRDLSGNNQETLWKPSVPGGYPRQFEESLSRSSPQNWREITSARNPGTRPGCDVAVCYSYSGHKNLAKRKNWRYSHFFSKLPQTAFPLAPPQYVAPAGRHHLCAAWGPCTQNGLAGPCSVQSHSHEVTPCTPATAQSGKSSVNFISRQVFPEGTGNGRKAGRATEARDQCFFPS